MKLPIRVEQPVHRVATRSSTKNRELERRARKDRRRARSRKVGEPDDSSSNSSFSLETARELDQVTSIAVVEKGVEENRIPRDVSREVREYLADPEHTLKPASRIVRFDETPVIIQPDLKPDEYDIIQDIKEQKANATIGQLLHDNPNYQKLVREEWPKKRRQKFRLPAVAVNWGIHLCERRVESVERRAVVGERKIDYLVVIFLEKEPLKPWKLGRLGSKFSLKLTKKTPKPWNMPSKIVR